MSDPKPVTFTEYSATEGTYDAEPLALIGALPAGSTALATTTVAGVVKKTAAEADLAGAADLPTTVAKVNALLAKLRTAGIVTP